MAKQIKTRTIWSAELELLNSKDMLTTIISNRANQVLLITLREVHKKHSSADEFDSLLVLESLQKNVKRVVGTMNSMERWKLAGCDEQREEWEKSGLNISDKATEMACEKLELLARKAMRELLLSIEKQNEKGIHSNKI